MSLLAITCPNTAAVVSTGIETDAVSFRRLPDVTTRSVFPACGKEHSRSKRDAQLIERPATEKSIKPAA